MLDHEINENDIELLMEGLDAIERAESQSDLLDGIISSMLLKKDGDPRDDADRIKQEIEAKKGGAAPN